MLIKIIDRKKKNYRRVSEIASIGRLKGYRYNKVSDYKLI